ncbi:hypothetical protein EDB19DRAFT_1718195 [Suillus lakei]|nr:hypothetical protein EDB19DRAFT_1718195 [Suillus lakei]
MKIMRPTPRIWLGSSTSSFLQLMQGSRRTEQICVHPKDPYKVSLSPPNSKRVDVLQFSRQTCMCSISTICPHFLFETGLPVRTYMPLVDIHVDILRPFYTITGRVSLQGVANDCNI